MTTTTTAATTTTIPPLMLAYTAGLSEWVSECVRET